MKYAEGYIRDIPGGDPIAGVSVTVRDDNTGTPIAAGGMTNCTTNPVNTDGSGFFSWSCELSPGPIKVDAVITGSQKKVRSGKERMQSGDYWLSDIPQYFTNFSNGIIFGNKNAYNATSASLNITLQTGAAILNGYLVEITTTRVLAVPSNVTLSERWDLVVLQQYIGGTSKGKQSIALKTGTVNQVDPVINTDPNILEFAIWRSKIANGGGVVALTDIRTYSSILVNPNQVTAAMLTAGGNLSTATTAKVLKAPTSGLTPLYATLSSAELSDFSSTGIAVGRFPEWAGTEWVPTVHDHSALFASISHNHNATYATIAHTHAHSALTGVDVDLATTDIHHTLGTGSLQAARGNHTHTGLVPAAHQNTHQTGGTDELSGTLEATAKVVQKSNGVTIGTRRGINLVAGTNITIGAVDNAGGERVDYTIDGLPLGTTGSSAAAGNHNHSGVYATSGHTHAGVYADASHSHSGFQSRMGNTTKSYAETTSTGADVLLDSSTLLLASGVTFDIFIFGIVQGHMRSGNLGNAQVGVRWESNATEWGMQVGTEEGERPLVATTFINGVAGDGLSHTYSLRGRTTGNTGTSEFFAGHTFAFAVPRPAGVVV